VLEAEAFARGAMFPGLGSDARPTIVERMHKKKAVIARDFFIFTPCFDAEASRSQLGWQLYCHPDMNRGLWGGSETAAPTISTFRTTSKRKFYFHSNPPRCTMDNSWKIMDYMKILTTSNVH
jgi:hypothetical protein